MNRGLFFAKGVFSAALVLAVSTACPPPGNGDDAGVTDDGGVAHDGGGNGGGGDAGGGGGGGGGGGELGSSCTFGSDECGEGRVCTSVFDSLDDEIDETTAACYAACEQQDAPCTAAFNQEGTCQPVAQPNDRTALACVASSPTLGPCGNGANATCTDDPFCISAQDENVGFCGTPCNPAGDDCPDDQACSTSPVRVNLGGGQTGGICSPPSIPGDPCGPDVASGTMRVCTGDQVCVQSTRTCELVGDAGPDPDDAGVGDAG